MEPQNSGVQRHPLRYGPKQASALVECTVQVSPNLARLIRKSAVAEAGGASTRNALLAAAGLRANEVEELHARAKLLADQLEEKQEIADQYKRRLDATEATAVERDDERIKLRQHLKKAVETEQKSRQTTAALEALIIRLEETIAGLEDDLRRSISTNGLESRAALALKAFNDRLRLGDDIETAALGIAGYERPEIENAVARLGSAEFCALDALLRRPSWRRRIVLRLLNVVSSDDPSELAH